MARTYRSGFSRDRHPPIVELATKRRETAALPPAYA